MKKILSVVLSIVMVLSLIPFYAVPTAAEGETQNEPVFSVEVSGNTFTITRSESWKQQTVAYRTVSVTAVEGIHFTAAQGTLTFNIGDTSKTVTVTETAVGDIPVRYRYQTGTYREYRLEVLDNYGFLLASGTRKIIYGDSYKFNNAYVNSSVTTLLVANGYSETASTKDVTYSPSNNTFIQVTDAGYKQAVQNISTNSLFSQSGIAPREYLSAIGDKLYAAVRFQVKEENDGYQYIQILADNSSTYDADDSNGTVSTPSTSYYKACFERDKSTTANSEAEYLAFPHRYDYKNRSEEVSAGFSTTSFASINNYLYAQKYRNDSVKTANSGAIVLDPTTQEINVRFDAAGSGSDTWDFRNLQARFAIGDETAPYATDQLYVSRNSAYLKHSPVTITICFNEIVKPTDCVLKTTWGDFHVISTGSYANVLSFSGAITADQGTQLKITGIDGTVSDLFNRNMQGTVSKSLSYTVGQSPTVPSSGGVYLISNAAELYAYADMLESYPNRSGRLMNDIDMSNSDAAGFKAMGGANGFTGTFDGNGHKIINLNNVSAAANGLCGLFGYVSAGGRVQNLDLEITFTAPLGSSGAICGLNLGTVENCTVSGKIYNSIADSDQSSSSNCFGGVVGDNRGNVIHCLALNEIWNTWQNLKAGGIVGYNSGTVESCCFNGAFSSRYDVTRGAVCGENANIGTIINCAARNINSNYYSYAIGANKGTATNTLYMPTSDFTSGKACYEVLNNGVSDGTQFWYQNLDNEQTHDDCPQFSGGTVYKHGNIYTNAIVHTLSHVDAVAAGCENEGHPEYWICTIDGCGKIFADENAQNETTLEALTISALGHDWSSMWYFDSAGHRHKCTRCGAVKDAAEHICSAPDYVWSSDNTQVTATKYCDVCHSTMDSETVSTTSDLVTATCTQGGTVTYTATFTKDGFTTQTKQVPTDALGHDWSSMWYFDSAGHRHKCTRCGAVKDEAEHICSSPDYVWSSDNTQVTATKYCDVCHGLMDSETVNTTSDYGTVICTQGGTVTYIATFTKDGFTTQTKQVSIGALGHDYVETVTAPTCTAQGYTTHTCSRCGDSYVDSYTDALGHDYVETVTAPTCTKQGYTTHTCSRCGDSYVDSYTDALGHDWQTGWRCGSDAHWHYCSRCNEKKDEAPHSFVSAPTWSWGGINNAEANFKCSVCNMVLGKSTDITYSVSGNLITATATVSFNGNTYTDTNTETGLTLGENTADIVAYDSTCYYFVPSEDGFYRFESTGDYDPRIYIYDKNNNLIAYNDDDGEDYNFLLYASLEAGKLYIIELYSYSETGDLTVFISKVTTSAITVDSAVEHGRVWVEDVDGNELTLAHFGQKLYIRQAPDSGYRLESVTVTDSSGNPINLDGSYGFIMPESDITVSAQFGSNALSMGENTVYIQRSTSQIYSFTPSQDGDYRFYSVGDYDPKITVKDEGGTQIGSHDDYDRSHGNRNFNLTVSLEAGKTYTVEIYSYNNYYNGYNTGFMTVFIEKAGLQYDINSDGVEDINDIGFILSASVGNTEMNWAQAVKADLNSDGTVDGFDAAELDRILASVNTAKGDVNQDGDIGLADYAMTRAHISGVAVDSNTPANLLDKSYLTAEYDGIKDNYPNGTIITQQYYCADYDGDKAVDAFDLFYLDKRINNIA